MFVCMCVWQGQGRKQKGVQVKVRVVGKKESRKEKKGGRGKKE